MKNGVYSLRGWMTFCIVCIRLGVEAGAFDSVPRLRLLGERYSFSPLFGVQAEHFDRLSAVLLTRDVKNISREVGDSLCIPLAKFHRGY